MINHFGGARAALDALPGLARRRSGRAKPPSANRRGGQALRALGGVGESAYPRRLQMIDDAPLLLVIRGHDAALAHPAVAIVV